LVIIVLAASQAALAQVERVDIVGAERAVRQVAPAPEQGGPSVALLIGVSAVVMATAAAGWWAWRRWSRLEDAERAFLLLCLRRGVRHKERLRLRHDAHARGVAPIAALLVGER